jgi:hypothetical protein
MAEEQESTGGSFKSILIGLASTIAIGIGGYVTKQLTGEGDEPAPQATSAPAPVINITQNQAQQQAASGGVKTVIIKEKAVPGVAQPAAAAQPKPKKKSDSEDFQKEPQW